MESLDGLFWEHPGDGAPYPANRMENGLYNFATNLASNAQRISYLKLQAVTVGYTLPEAVRKATGFGARIFISGENLFTLTDYRGGDRRRWTRIREWTITTPIRCRAALQSD